MQSLTRLVLLALLLLMLCGPGIAQDSRQAAERISFDQLLWEDVREGYVTLSWNEFAGAAAYQVLDGDGRSIYRGGLRKAFISGLSNGKHFFRLRVGW